MYSENIVENIVIFLGDINVLYVEYIVVCLYFVILKFIFFVCSFSK